MTDRRTFLYRIDADNIITFVSPEWLAFAAENGAPHLVAPGVLGQPLKQFIADIQTQHLYNVLLTQVRTGRSEIRVPFRCDAPDQRRYMELVMRSWAGKGIEFRSHVLREEPRPSVKWLSADAARSDRMVRMCSYCKRVATPEWVEVEEAISRLRLFEQDYLPQITHGICTDCHQQLQKTIAATSPS
jgi:hypothetical protein